ncbi:MAG: hypothetical protein AAGD25_19960 [Cyanobacteria bacterium P01_F01_bin.150]
MRLYSYRGVLYTIAPATLASDSESLLSNLNSVSSVSQQPSSSVPAQSSSQELSAPSFPSQAPTAAIPMMYRGVMYLLERFNTPCPSFRDDFTNKCTNESIESTEPTKSAKSTDD